MSVPTRGGIATLRLGAFALFAALGIVASQPASAQTRSLAMLADVQALMPAPYHPQTATATYSTSLYDTQLSNSGSQGGVRFWH